VDKGGKEDKGSQCVGRLRRLEATGVDKGALYAMPHAQLLTSQDRGDKYKKKESYLGSSPDHQGASTYVSISFLHWGV